MLAAAAKTVAAAAADPVQKGQVAAVGGGCGRDGVGSTYQHTCQGLMAAVEMTAAATARRWVGRCKTD